MNYYQKYLKYKSKYIELKKTQHQYGGTTNPLVLYIVGQDKNPIRARSYICTLLYQLEFFRKNNSTNNNKIHIIYGDNEANPNTCKSIKAFEKNDLPIPYGIDVTYTMGKLIANVMEKIINEKSNPTDPLIIIYDGHGPVKENNPKNGTMVLDARNSITDDILTSIIKNTNRIESHNLFILTQCGSFDYYDRIKNKLPGIYILSTNNPNECGMGAQILIDYTTALQNNKEIYTFNDLKEKIKLAIYASDNRLDTELNTFFKSINKKPIVMNLDNYLDKTVALFTDAGYLSYDASKLRNIGSIIMLQAPSIASLWRIVRHQDKYYIRTDDETIEQGGTYGRNYNILNQYNPTTVVLWNKTPNFVNELWSIDFLDNGSLIIHNNHKYYLNNNKVSTTPLEWKIEMIDA